MISLDYERLTQLLVGLPIKLVPYERQSWRDSAKGDSNESCYPRMSSTTWATKFLTVKVEFVQQFSPAPKKSHLHPPSRKQLHNPGALHAEHSNFFFFLRARLRTKVLDTSFGPALARGSCSVALTKTLSRERPRMTKKRVMKVRFIVLAIGVSILHWEEVRELCDTVHLVPHAFK